ncbi:MAG: cytochrome c oxidase assembly protein [Thermomicrobiales bacterium]
MPHVPIPVLHGGSYPHGPLHSAWSFDPSVVLGVFGLIAAYIAWTGPLNRRRPGIEGRPVSAGQTTAFVAGSLALLLALSPPLDDWADSYLLSVHMFQHLILLIVVAPLWLIGTPGWVLRPLTTRPTTDAIGRAVTRPVPAFVISNAIIVIWHMPSTFDAALNAEPVHVVQHLCFLAAGVLMWWPVLSPLPEWPRLAPLLQCLYLFLQTIPSGAIGAFITLASPGVYDAYVGAPRLWGISLDVDQQIAGVMMWVIENAIYLSIITIIFFKWAGREEQAARGEDPNAAKRLSTAHQ